MKAILILLLLILQLSANCQNLLVNGGFEDENICTEYHVNCAPEAWISTSPSFQFYFKEIGMAHNGTHCMGLLAGEPRSNFKRTFIRSRPVCRLRKGHQYRLSFFIRSRHAILDSVGIYFSSYDFLFEQAGYQNVVPTLYVSNATEPTNATDTSWQQVALDYTATGEENFISIGYFGKTDLKTNKAWKRESDFLILIDDLEMIALDPKELLCSNWQSNANEIYSQNERHEYLELTIRLFRYDRPPVTAFAYTTMPVPPIAKPTPAPQVIDTLIIPDILFASASATLKKESHPLLDSFCAALVKKPFDSLVVAGHTDNVGSVAYNTKLSEDRSNAVAYYIRQKLALKENNIIVHYYAFSKPVATNNTAAGRQKNRRVEIFVYRHY